jgi:FixJ family two-component response regulator
MNIETADAQKILFVDDEPNILDAFERQFRKRFRVETALGAERALDLVSTNGPYAVIVSDLRMPGMNGIQFLSEAKAIAPQSVRIMLTGHADTEAAIAAVNQGNIFRFLNKPCPGEILDRTLEDALEQNRLVRAEHELLEQTLRGAIAVLTELLSLSSPQVFSQTARLRTCVHHIALRLKCADAWRFEVAAMLSHIGCITVPAEILRKHAAGEALSETERRVFEAHPQIGHGLLVKIPRLESVAEMVQRQNDICHDPDEASRVDESLLGARMLKAAIDLDFLHMAGVPYAESVARMRTRGGYSLRVLDALSDFPTGSTNEEIREVWVRDLVAGMVVAQDVIANNGLLLLARGQGVTPPVIARLESFRDTHGVVEPFRVHALLAAIE